MRFNGYKERTWIQIIDCVPPNPSSESFSTMSNMVFVVIQTFLTLVKPQGIPPVHRHEIPEPLMGEL
jgi:hypothetical protein